MCACAGAFDVQLNANCEKLKWQRKITCANVVYRYLKSVFLMLYRFPFTIQQQQPPKNQFNRFCCHSVSRTSKCEFPRRSVETRTVHTRAVWIYLSFSVLLHLLHHSVRSFVRTYLFRRIAHTINMDDPWNTHMQTMDGIKCAFTYSIARREGRVPHFYNNVHTRGFVCGVFSTARTASWNTSSMFCFFLAEHSTNVYALILCFSFFASE